MDSPVKIAEHYITQYCGLKNENDFATTIVYEGAEGEMFWKWFNLQVRIVTHKMKAVHSLSGIGIK